jgi:hypothetical protein
MEQKPPNGSIPRVSMERRTPGSQWMCYFSAACRIHHHGSNWTDATLLTTKCPQNENTASRSSSRASSPRPGPLAPARGHDPATKNACNQKPYSGAR